MIPYMVIYIAAGVFTVAGGLVDPQGPRGPLTAMRPGSPDPAAIPPRERPPMSGDARPIDREAVVRRHNVTVTAPDPEHVLTVGNGDFAYTADITGMQTFTAFHDQGAAIMQGRAAINTSTMSTWGWHEMPNTEGFVLEDAMSDHTTRRGVVRYPDRHDMEGAMRGQVSEENRPGAWLNAEPAANRPRPHRAGVLRRARATRSTSDRTTLTDTVDSSSTCGRVDHQQLPLRGRAGRVSDGRGAR